MVKLEEKLLLLSLPDCLQDESPICLATDMLPEALEDRVDLYNRVSHVLRQLNFARKSLCESSYITLRLFHEISVVATTNGSVRQNLTAKIGKFI